ncbi:MAG: glycosyltransferase family 2 protein [Bacteroidales bacterium]|nr:glycosyltransferase family 2 protein [Bacteroidales bacterium]
MKELAIVLPIYNQESHIEIIINNFTPELEKENIDYEIIFVVNGSKDRSFEKCLDIASTNPKIKAYELKESGWGRAVKHGIQQANARWIAYTNSARTHIDDLKTCIRYAQVDDSTVVKANRIIRESFMRRLGSVIYNFENRYFFKTAIWDVNGTPKIFPGEFLQNQQIISNGDLIDAELMALCNQKRMTVIEIPIYATDRISGKSTTKLRSAIKMYFGLFKLKKHLKNG